MTDLDWRRKQRAWESDPEDQAALRAYIAARRRADLPVTDELLERRRFPARSFESSHALEVRVQPVQGAAPELRLPGRVDLPEHTYWSIETHPEDDAQLLAIVDELRDQDVHSLIVEAAQVSRDGLSALAQLGSLEILTVTEAADLTDDVLTRIVSGVPHLVELRLSLCTALTDDGLRQVGELARLVTLYLSGASFLGWGLDCLSGLTSLRDLTIRNCHGVSNVGLDALRDLGLQRLELGDCELIGDQGLEHVATLDDLESLTLSGMSMSREGLRALEGMPRLAALELDSVDLSGPRAPLPNLPLKALNFGSQDLTDADLEGLPTSLESLKGYAHPVTDSGFAHLARLTELRVLDLAFAGEVTDEGMSALSSLTRLERLDLFGATGISGAGVSAIAELPDLVDLSLSATECCPDALTHVAKLTQLTHLGLYSCELTDDDLAHLSDLVLVEELDISDSNSLTGAGLVHLHRLTRLEELKLSFTEQLVDEHLKHLGALTGLKVLELAGCDALVGTGLTGLPPGLEELDLSYCDGVSDAALGTLTRLTSLRSLNLGRCQLITDAGLQHLAPMTWLEVLELTGSEDTERAAKHILPDCTILVTEPSD